jgi:hypothetical protein
VLISFIYSKRAREERAIAAQKRLRALQDQAKDIASEESEESDDEIEIIEIDAERQQTLLNSGEQGKDPPRLDKANSWKEFQREFNFDYTKDECDLPVASGSTFTTASTGKKNLSSISLAPLQRQSPLLVNLVKAKYPLTLVLGNSFKMRSSSARGKHSE